MHTESFKNVGKGDFRILSDVQLTDVHLDVRIIRTMTDAYFNRYTSTKKTISRVGNFIIGDSGSDKQMLFASSGARAALNIAAEKSKQKR